MSHDGGLVDHRFGDSVELHDLAPSTLDPELVAAVARELDRGVPIIVEGPALVGKASVVVAAVAARGRATLVVDLARIDADLIELAEREAVVRGAALVLRAAEWVALPEITRNRALERVQRGVAILTVRDGSEPERTLRSCRRIRIAMPPVALRQRIWNAALDSDVATFDLCVRLPLVPGQITRAAATAREVATREHRPITIHDLERAARDLEVEPKQPHDRRYMRSKLAPLAASLFTMLVASTTNADPKFYSSVKDDLVVHATFPNGKVETRKLSAGADTNSSEYFLVPPGVESLAIEVKDDLGNVVWKGKAGKDDVHVMIPDGKGYKGVFAGLAAASFSTPKVAIFMNATGEAMTLDLEGHNGVGAHRGISPKGGFDIKDAIRLDPGEATFDILIKAGSATPVKIGTATPGRHYLISKKPSGGYRALMLGAVPSPPATKKGGK